MFYILVNKETGKAVKDQEGNLVTFLHRPDPTFKFSVKLLEEKEIEMIYNQKVDSYGL